MQRLPYMEHRALRRALAREMHLIETRKRAIPEAMAERQADAMQKMVDYPIVPETRPQAHYWNELEQQAHEAISALQSLGYSIIKGN